MLRKNAEKMPTSSGNCAFSRSASASCSLSAAPAACAASSRATNDRTASVTAAGGAVMRCVKADLSACRGGAGGRHGGSATR